MAKRLTITVSDEVYDGLHRRVGRRHIGRFLDDLTRPHVTEPQPGGPGWEQGIAEQYRSAAAEAADPVLTRETNEWLGADLGNALRQRIGTRCAMRRGKVRWVDLEPATGREIGATRPCIIVSNDAANRHSDRVQVLPITSNVSQIHRWEVLIALGGVPRKALADQIRTVAKERDTTRLGTLTPNELRRIEHALRFQLGLS